MKRCKVGIRWVEAVSPCVSRVGRVVQSSGDDRHEVFVVERTNRSAAKEDADLRSRKLPQRAFGIPPVRSPRDRYIERKEIGQPGISEGRVAWIGLDCGHPGHRKIGQISSVGSWPSQYHPAAGRSRYCGCIAPGKMISLGYFVVIGRARFSIEYGLHA